MANQVQTVFENFFRRRNGILKAVREDSDELCKQCNGDTSEQLILVGLPNETWMVTPINENPINNRLHLKVGFISPSSTVFEKYCWLNDIAKKSDAWLMGMTFKEAHNFGFNRAQRGELYDLIADVPTIVEVLNSTTHRHKAYKKSCGVCDQYVYDVDQSWVACTNCWNIFHTSCGFDTVDDDTSEDDASEDDASEDDASEEQFQQCPRCHQQKVRDIGSFDNNEEAAYEANNNADDEAGPSTNVYFQTSECGSCQSEFDNDGRGVEIYCTVCYKGFHTNCAQVVMTADAPVPYVCHNCSSNVSKLERALAPYAEKSTSEESTSNMEDDDDGNESRCGACKDLVDFWVSCVVCKEKFHGKCVGIYPGENEKRAQFKCKKCCNKRGYNKPPHLRLMSHVLKKKP